MGLRQPRADQPGMALVIVLWITALLAVMAGSFAYSMRIETRLAASMVERVQAQELAEAGVAYALAWQLDPEARKQWPPNGDERVWSFGAGQLRIQVVDASGLINLNTADAELLKKLLTAAGVASGDQDRLAEAILEQRNPDERQRLGAKPSAAAFSPRLRPAGFESIEDLQQVPGMTPAIYARIASLMTVFSQHRGVNPGLAPARVLLALGMDERAVADYVQSRARAAADGLPPPPVAIDQGQFVSFQMNANVYHVRVIAETATGATALVEAVIDNQRTNLGKLPRGLMWRDGR
ncbi:MAG: general secretion pathway protein GspK [Candidatus Contendobacter sp.]|nr:general secretion pathway protein GspK [Candidatus Contendobacter sp.]